MSEDNVVNLPVPISCIDNKYLLFDIQAISWLRKNHHICGVFIGTLPQNPSQNIFLGLPMEIMPEEAQLLIDAGVGYILDDARAHDEAMAKMNSGRRREYANEVRIQIEELSNAKARERELEKRKAMKKQKQKQKQKDYRENDRTLSTNIDSQQVGDSAEPESQEDTAAESLFEPPPDDIDSPVRALPSNIVPDTTLSMTPTTSALLLPLSPPSSPHQFPLPGVKTSSYSLYRHLHNLNLTSHPSHRSSTFTTPGLRFGCQFCVYPSDPLRFHSHFLAVSVDWEEEIDLMDIVGGGRLGTGVKKAWLLGGQEEREGRVRCFSIEWAGM